MLVRLGPRLLFIVIYTIFTLYVSEPYAIWISARSWVWFVRFIHVCRFFVCLHAAFRVWLVGGWRKIPRTMVACSVWCVLGHVGLVGWNVGCRYTPFAFLISDVAVKVLHIFCFFLLVEVTAENPYLTFVQYFVCSLSLIPLLIGTDPQAQSIAFILWTFCEHWYSNAAMYRAISERGGPTFHLDQA